MSFDYNPLKHIEVVDDNGIRIHCHSCGGSRPKHGEPGLSEGTSALELFALMRDHVVNSHGRSDADFASWSIY